ncbi:EscU/YscU/HrcU family type III secretion system export apparatus switch protein [Bosea sp. PAMC 26642]|uniref:EscU/YscU/HrcU family type III secretion system export apparatus switch protein n=1 Tax=Bosea sp. (strain PAMC 26642) TaxID=1792307 RepID=UPI0007704014|nr:EscU/YscU/HrcU family type III secretion system export apparatus switch protein [Bosea sp. PAMC 26642]AMJ62646.1 flagellar biosynthetic protein FlhB [Bosea sp. PAMC 26642]
MSDDQDKDSKTEEPSEKKIQDAVERGNTPSSKEAPIFASIAATLIAGVFLIRTGAGDMARFLSDFLGDPSGFDISTNGNTTNLLIHAALRVGTFLGPVLLLFTVFGLSATFLQHPPQLALERITPQWSRISPAKGWARIFGAQGFMEFGKSLAKLVAIAGTTWLILKSDKDTVVTAMLQDPSNVPELILSLAIRLLSAACVATIVIVAVDLVWTQKSWRRSLRMTKQEIKEEHKQAEGDPILKSRRLSLARDRARNRMMAAVPRATLIIANPTHYAVALRYVQEEGGAPLVLAKGTDLIALKIREIAEANDIPVIEDRVLARSLHASVQLDQMIPPEFYKVVAELLCLVYAKKVA